MTTILFVHGTGVRAERYGSVVGQVRAGFAATLPDVVVEALSWGEVLGVPPRKGRLEGPEQAAVEQAGEPESGSARDGLKWSDAERAVWARLYDDPLFEIRLAALDARTAGPAASPRAVAVQRQRLRAVPDSEGLRPLLPETGAVDLRKAVEGLLDEREFLSALPARSSTPCRPRPPAPRPTSAGPSSRPWTGCAGPGPTPPVSCCSPTPSSTRPTIRASRRSAVPAGRNCAARQPRCPVHRA